MQCKLLNAASVSSAVQNGECHSLYTGRAAIVECKRTTSAIQIVTAILFVLITSISTHASAEQIEEIYIKNLGGRSVICIDGKFQGIAESGSKSYIDRSGYRGADFKPRTSTSGSDLRTTYQGGWDGSGPKQLLVLSGDVGSAPTYWQTELPSDRTVKVSINGEADITDEELQDFNDKLSPGQSNCRVPTASLEDVFSRNGTMLTLRDGGGGRMVGDLSIRGEIYRLAGQRNGNRISLKGTESDVQLSGELTENGILLKEGSATLSLNGAKMPKVTPGKISYRGPDIFFATFDLHGIDWHWSFDMKSKSFMNLDLQHNVQWMQYGLYSFDNRGLRLYEINECEDDAKTSHLSGDLEIGSPRAEEYSRLLAEQREEHAENIQKLRHGQKPTMSSCKRIPDQNLQTGLSWTGGDYFIYYFAVEGHSRTYQGPRTSNRGQLCVVPAWLRKFDPFVKCP